MNTVVIPATNYSQYGWKPDAPDHRDFLYAAIKPTLPVLPQVVDLRSLCSPVEEQQTLGCCVGHGVVGALEFLENKEKKQFVALSRLFVYYNAREIEGTTHTDSGALIRDGVNSVAKYGVCSEKSLPYILTRFRNKPNDRCYKEALQHKVSSYHRLDNANLGELKTCLADGYPFVFGFTVYTAFESEAVARTGILNLPAKGEQIVGGHCVLVVGYDEHTQRFLVRNSWGLGWGINGSGYFTIPYVYLTNSRLSDDFWTLRQ